MEKKSLIRIIYLYSFSAIGLILLIVGLINFLNMALKAFVFTQADNKAIYYDCVENVALKNELNSTFNQEEKNKIKSTNETVCLDNKDKQKIQYLIDKVDNLQKSEEKAQQAIVADRQREAARNLAIIIIGLPLYIYHWLTIKKEINKKSTV